MLSTDKLTRYALIAIIAGLTLTLLSEWSRYSREYDAEQREKLRALSQLQPELLMDDEPPAAGETYRQSEDSVSDFDGNEDIEPPIENTALITGNEIEKARGDAPETQPSAGGRQITLENDTISVTIDKLGGNITEVRLLKHLESLDEDSQPLRLLEKSPLRNYTAQSGLIGKAGSDVKSARAVFSSERNIYSNKTETVEAALRFKDASGVVLIKTFSLVPGSHLIDIQYRIENQSNQPWQGNFYAQIARDNSEDPGNESSGFGMQSYLGTATTNEDTPYKKISFKDIEKENYRQSQTGGWVAMIQHYFVSAWIPDQQQTQHYFTKKSRSGLNIIGFYSDRLDVPVGETGAIGAKFYAGPKNQYQLAKYAKHLDLTVDYGWLWWLAQPLYALLYFFSTGELHIFDNVYKVFSGFHNWGIAIIMLTICVKAAFFKLSATSYRSMANMRRVQPKLLAIRERHGNDKQAQSKAMMELYQKEKINPLGGCLPILIQMPVFIALYWALMESVELRHASFLWMKDLSVMDPFFILPITMGATMWFQQKMNPAPPDPMQAKVMAWMPIIFTFFFLWFPAGLVVYWVSNNILSIIQQWVITRSIEKENAA